MSREQAKIRNFAQVYGLTAAQQANARAAWRQILRRQYPRHYNGAASVETICKRIQYGGRKGKSALRKLPLIAKDARALLLLRDLKLDMSPGSVARMLHEMQRQNVPPDANDQYRAFAHPAIDV